MDAGIPRDGGYGTEISWTTVSEEADRVTRHVLLVAMDVVERENACRGVFLKMVALAAHMAKSWEREEMALVALQKRAIAFAEKTTLAMWLWDDMEGEYNLPESDEGQRKMMRELIKRGCEVTSWPEKMIERRVLTDRGQLQWCSNEGSGEGEWRQWLGVSRRVDLQEFEEWVRKTEGVWTGSERRGILRVLAKALGNKPDASKGPDTIMEVASYLTEEW